MKKKFLSFLTLALALCMGFSMTACGEEEPDASNSSSNICGEPIVSPTGEEEIFANIKQAIATTSAYDGNFTVTSEYSSESDTYTSKNKLIKSVDLKEKKAVGLEEDEYAQSYGEFSYEGKRVIKEKVWQENDDLLKLEFEKGWDYDKEEWIEYATEYNFLGNYSWQDSFSGYSPSAFIEEMVGLNLLTVSDLATLRSNYNQVAADSETKQKQVDPNASAEVKIETASEDGVVSFIASSAISTTVDGYALSSTSLATYSFKNGYFLKAETENNHVTTETATGKSSTATYYSSYAYSYEFDEELYNSTVLTTPETAPSPESLYGEIKVGYQDRVFTLDVYGATAEEAVDDLNSNFYEACESADVWYTDEACTMKLDTTGMTADELMEIGTLYVKELTLNEDYAIIIETEKTVCDFSPLYASVYAYSEYEYSYVEVYSAGETYDVYGAPNTTIYVNGEKKSAGEIVLEGGQLYFIEEVETRTDDTETLFEMVMMN